MLVRGRIALQSKLRAHAHVRALQHTRPASPQGPAGEPWSGALRTHGGSTLCADRQLAPGCIVGLQEYKRCFDTPAAGMGMGMGGTSPTMMALAQVPAAALLSPALLLMLPHPLLLPLLCCAGVHAAHRRGAG